MNPVASAKSTKPKSKVWKYFNVKTTKKGTFYVCQYCNAEYKKNATRMQKHLGKCLTCPKFVKNIFSSSGGDAIAHISSTFNDQPACSGSERRAHSERSDVSAKTDASSLSDIHPQAPQPRATSAQGRSVGIGRYFDSMNQVEMDELHELFARAVFASSTPLRITEIPYWTEFFKKLRPSYKMPSRFKLSNILLDNEFERVKLEVESKVQMSTGLGLQCDGWTNRRNEAIINFILTTPQPIFFKTIATEAEKHTGEYLASKLIEILEEVGPKKILAIVTDNATAMIKARDIVYEKYKHIAVYSCAAHTLNLLIGDIMKCKSIITLENDAKSIVKEINGSHLLTGLFNSIKTERHSTGRALKLPVKTRWGSIVLCFKSLMSLKYELKALAVKEDADKHLSKRSVTNILDEDIFWVRITKMYDLLNPILKWITILESDKPRISMVPEAFKDISSTFDIFLSAAPINKQEEKTITEALQSRKGKALKPIHFAANILDPKYNGECLDRESQVQGTEFIHNLLEETLVDYDSVQGEILVEFAEYRSKEGFYGKKFVLQSAEKTDPVSWWKGTCHGSKLSKLAVNILTMPPTTAATERSFSTYGNVHSAKRNKLTIERAGKLTYIAHNLKLLSANYSEEEREQPILPSSSRRLFMEVKDNVPVAMSASVSSQLNAAPSTSFEDIDIAVSETETEASSTSNYTVHDESDGDISD